VDVNASTAQLRRGGTGEGELGMLRGRVRSRRRERDRTCDRDDVDDVGASRGFEPRQERAQGPHRTEVVDTQDLLEPIQVDDGEPRAPRDTCVVHEQVNLRMTLQYRRRYTLDIFSATDVAHLVFASKLLGERAQALLAAGEQDQAPAFPGERAGDCLADSARRAGDDCYAGAIYRQTFTWRVAVKVRPPASVATARS
jgi:hypothetical protein